MTAAPPLQYVCGLVAYDGTAYHGFQYQHGVATIQAVLEEALVRFAQVEGRVLGAGRTDAGVHAAGQVVAVKVAWRHPVGKLQDAWNAHLPPSVTVRRLVEAPAGFHPRFSAHQRTYRYTVWAKPRQGPDRLPLHDRFGWTVSSPLDLAAMNRAAALVVGEHDFATFGAPTQGNVTRRRVDAAEWSEVETSLPSLQPDSVRQLVLTIQANGFLRNMVRSLVGAFVAVGRGDWSVAAMQEALAAQDRSRAAPPAPPQGLVLEQVAYPEAVDPWAGESSTAVCS